MRGKGHYEQFRKDDELGNYKIDPIQIGNETITSSDLVRQRWLSNYFYGSTFSFDYNNFKRFTANVGGGWTQYDGDHFGDVVWARFSGNSNVRHRYYDNTDLTFMQKGITNYQMLSMLS